MKKTKKNFAMAGALTIGALVVAAPISSIANEEDPLLEQEPTPDDVVANSSFVIDSAVEGSNVTLTWSAYEGAESYRVAKFIHIDTEYVLLEEVHVTTAQYDGTVSENGNYMYRVAPLVDGEYVLDSVGEVKFSVSAASVQPPDDTETNDEELPEDEPTSDEEPKEDDNEKPSDEEKEQEEQEEQEEKTDEKPKEETVATELTEEQLQEIGVLAKEFAEVIVEHPEYKKLFEDFVSDLTQDKTFIDSFVVFYDEELTPFIEEEALAIDLGNNLDAQITELENKVNEKVTKFFNENDRFNHHAQILVNKTADFALDDVFNDFDNLLLELAGEGLHGAAQDEFLATANQYLYDETYKLAVGSLDEIIVVLEQAVVNDDEPKEDDDEKPSDEEPKEDDDEKPSDKEPKEDDDEKPSDKEPKEDDDEKPSDKEPKEDDDEKPSDEEPKEDKDTPVTNTDKDRNKDDNDSVKDDPNTDQEVNDSTNGDVNDPSVPKTGDGSIQKMISPLAATLVAMMVAFILVPNRLTSRNRV